MVKAPTVKTPTAKTTDKASTKNVVSVAGSAKSAGAETVRPMGVVKTDSESSEPVLKKVELIARVVEVSGIKKRFAKPAIEAALAILGEALSEGRDLNLQPLGKVMPRNSKDLESGKVINARIRQSTRKKTEARDPLAEGSE